ncbi:MAG TPA: cytochrome o ubiquinol oxidase subunit IV [Candidatus Saccharimonadales bacterium]|nr:cytochrome o ubiquinol oxidase subunit IV [Candidatus Saccharimonadales bacterium]
MDNKTNMAVARPARPREFVKYIVGFVLSLALTLVAYEVVVDYQHGSLYSHDTRLLIIAALAITQLMVQLVFFLNVADEGKPRWNLMMLMFAGMVIFILVAGSLWIMHNLNYNMTQRKSTTQVNNYLSSQDGL